MAATHIPINHHLRNFYRVLAALAGIYVLVFGIVGLVETWGTPLFGRQSTWALGLRTNLAFALLSIVVGAIVVIGAFIGRNVARNINLVAGVVFLAAGMVMMTLLQTDGNLLNFTMSTCIVSFVIGGIFGIAGLYGKVGRAEQRHQEEAFRHGGIDPEEHAWPEEQRPAHST